MKPLALLLLLLVSFPVHAQAVAPAPAPVRPPPVMTPGYFPGSTGNPVHTPTGAGLPTTGQPGTQGADVPRSPNKRVLPPTKEPGLWAADGAPKATREGSTDVFGVTIPYPDNAGEAEKRAVDTCSNTIMDAAYAAKRSDYLSSLPLNVRQCLAFSAYEHCARSMRDVFPPNIRIQLSEEVRRLLSDILTHASDLATRYCTKGLIIDEAARAAYREVIDKWIQKARAAKPIGN